MAFRIWSPGSTAAGRLRPAAANLLLGQMADIPLVLAFYSLSESYRYSSSLSLSLDRDAIIILTTHLLSDYYTGERWINVAKRSSVSTG